MKIHKIMQTLLGSALAVALVCLLITMAGGQIAERGGQSRKAARKAAAAEGGRRAGRTALRQLALERQAVSAQRRCRTFPQGRQ